MIAFFHLFNDSPADVPVRATLGDGQVLMGELKTHTLRLATGAGIVDIPLGDVGEVVPATGGELGVAEGQVDVWLRNGSELRGRWTEPELAMDIAVGGHDVGVDLPMNQLSRFQLQGREAWPQGPVFRMRTAWGDDFLVDPERTKLVISNQLGTFEPMLAECRYAAPVGAADGEWRIELTTGTVLIGKLQDDAVTVALPMGPEAITVPLDHFVSLRLETWAPVYAAATTTSTVAMPTPALGEGARAPAAAREERAAEEQWFDNGALSAAKDANR